MFEVGKDYLFVLKKSIPILDADPVSDAVYDYYSDWGQLDGMRVTCLKSIPKRGSAGSLYHVVRVYLSKEDEDFWFETSGKYLHPITNQCDSTDGCTCDLSLLMISGCKCGAFATENKS